VIRLVPGNLEPMIHLGAGMLAKDPCGVRRRLSLVFAAIYALSILLFQLHARDDDLSAGRAVLNGLFYTFFVCNLVYGL